MAAKTRYDNTALYRQALQKAQDVANTTGQPVVMGYHNYSGWTHALASNDQEVAELGDQILLQPVLYPHWVIKTTGEKPYYVSQQPSIKFAPDQKDALKLSKQQALGVLDILADMQNNSSFQKPDSYILTCVKS